MCVHKKKTLQILIDSKLDSRSQAYNAGQTKIMEAMSIRTPQWPLELKHLRLYAWGEPEIFDRFKRFTYQMPQAIKLLERNGVALGVASNDSELFEERLQAWCKKLTTKY